MEMREVAEKGPWGVAWFEQIHTHLRAAREELRRLPEVTGRIHSAFPGPREEPVVDTTASIEAIDRILDPAFRPKLEARAWPNIDAFA
jgi:hypothetical protein